MRLAVVSLTKNGAALAETIVERLPADHYARWKQGIETAVRPFSGKFTPLVGELFENYDGIIFIMACGIVVRSVARFLTDKRNDPAILVVDEKGEHVISFLSGHYGGANQLARRVAALIGGRAVITTATDVNQVIAFDVFSRDNDCVIENDPLLKSVSAVLVNGGTVVLHTPYRLRGELSPQLRLADSSETPAPVDWAVVVDNDTANQPAARQVLFIRPQNLILGIGCKKGTSKAAIADAITDFFQRNHKSFLALKKMVSIEHKAAEPGILEYCAEHYVVFQTFTAAELLPVAEQLASSPFVKQTVGVGNVAEAAALSGGDHTRLICGKMVYPGITLALAEEEREFQL